MRRRGSQAARHQGRSEAARHAANVRHSAKAAKAVKGAKAAKAAEAAKAAKAAKEAQEAQEAQEAKNSLGKPGSQAGMRPARLEDCIVMATVTSPMSSGWRTANQLAVSMGAIEAA